MEFITMSFAEILALQNILNKDEEEDIIIAKKTGGHRKATNKGERAAQKKAKMTKKATKKNHGRLHKEGENFYEVYPLSFVDGSSYGKVVGNEYKPVSPRELAHRANEPKWGRYDHLCKEEAVKKAERRVERSELTALPDNVEENAEAVRQALQNAKDNLGYAEYMVKWAEAHHEELNNELSWLEYEPAGDRTVKAAYEEYCRILLERDDFVPQLRKWRALYNEELFNYNQAKAEYDALPFWL